MNRKTKWSHRLLALALAAVMCCSVFPVGAFAETPLPQESTVATEEQQTDETETDNGQTDASNPDPGATTEESAAPTTDEPAEENEPYTFDGEILYADMPDAPTGSYIGSYGLPVATGEIKIGLSAWDADLEQDSYLSAEALDSDNLTLTTPLLEDTDYAIVPILAQVEYPADGSTLDLILPDGVTLLDYYGAPAENAESLLHNEYSETSAAVLGVYVQADADFTAQLVYTAPDGSCLTKTLQVTIDRNVTAEYPFPDSEIAAFAERPTPAVTSGKITKVAKVNGTWLIWFNGEPAYCCTHGANGQPAGCPTYTYVNTSTVNADQCIPGDHYGNQIRIWGGLNQLSLGDADDLPAVFSADEGEEISLLDFCASIYDDVQMYIIENFPESTTAEIYLASADELLNGVETYASARGYYTYIYNPGRAGWQTVALIGPEIGEEEPEPEPVVQEYYASWEAPAQTASGSFDFSYGVRTDKIQTATLEKVDGATIEIEPTTKSGSIEGGNWSISPAGKQTVTTSGHTADDNYQKNGGDASASWSLHYAVTKTSGTRNGQVGPFTTQEAADAAANSARDAAIFSNDTGNIRVQGLPYGTYLVVETTVPHDLFQAEPFIVTVDPEQDNNPWGAMATPKDSVMTGSDSYQKFTVLDEEIEVYLRITKVDEETGKPVLLPDTAFQIYWLDEQGHYRYDSNGNPKLVTMTDTVNGHLTKDVDTFYTNSEGILTLPEKLPLGKYRIVEVTGPNGFYNEWLDSAGYENGILADDADGIYYVDFEITTDRIYAATGDKNENGMDTLVIGENYSNHETLGKLTIRKTGEVLAGWKTEVGALDPWMTGEAEDGNFVYETRPLASAEYTITAAEDIYVAIEKARGNGGRILGVNLLMAAAKFTLSGVFVLIFRQGVVMIAFSTLLSNLLVTLIGIYSLRDPKDVFGISLEYIRMDRLFIKKLFGISLPVMAEKFAFSTGKVVVNSVGVDYGTQTVGALGVSNSISALSTVPAGSIGDGGASIIRQNIGSGKKDRALKVFKSVFLVDVAWGTLGFLLTWIFLNPILSVFSGGDAVFAQLIRQIFLLEMLSNIFLAVHAAIMALLYAFGYTKLSFGINFARLFIFRLPILFALKQFTALSGGTAMGIVMMVSNGLTGLFALLVAMVVLRKEYGSGWIKLLLH